MTLVQALEIPALGYRLSLICGSATEDEGCDFTRPSVASNSASLSLLKLGPNYHILDWRKPWLHNPRNDTVLLKNLKVMTNFHTEWRLVAARYVMARVSFGNFDVELVGLLVQFLPLPLLLILKRQHLMGWMMKMP